MTYGEKMKRLLCIVSSLDVGGAETFMMKIFRNLAEEYKIDFIVSTETGFYEEEVEKLGGKIFRIPLRTKQPIKSFMDIYKIVKKNKYQYILKLCDTPIGVVDLWAAKLGGANRLCVRSCNANSSHNVLRHIAELVLRPFFNSITDIKIAPSNLAAIYTFGKKTVKSGKVILLNNAVDVNEFRYDECARIKVRKEFGIKEEQIVFGHIGRFNNQKNHLFLIEIFKQIQELTKGSVLLLIGDGELKETIASKVKEEGLDEVILMPGIRSDIPQLLSAMDVFLFPSLYEGMPNTVIEAQATGLPCLISDTITREAKITNLVEYFPLSTSAECWAQLSLKLSDYKRNDRRQEFIVEKYDIKTVVEEFTELIFGEINREIKISEKK